MPFDQFGGRREGPGGVRGEANQAVLDATPESERSDDGGPERTDDGKGPAEPSLDVARSAVGDSVGDTDRDLVDAAPGHSNGDSQTVVEAAPAGKVTVDTDRQVGESEPVGTGRSAGDAALVGAPDQEFVNAEPADSRTVIESTSIDDATSDTDREALGSSSSDAGRSDADPDAAGDVDQELVDAEPAEPEVADGRPAASVKVAAFDADQDVADSGSVGDAAAGTDRPAETAATDQRAEPPYSPLRVPDATGRRPSDALFTFEPDKAGLPPLTMEKAERYLETVDLKERPWLKGIDDCSREARYVIAAIDLADGHALQRHEGHASGQNGIDRLVKLHDMANVNDISRMKCEDAFEVDENGDPKRHQCDAAVSCINDLEAIAIAYAAASQHGDVRVKFGKPLPPMARKTIVDIPIEEALGPSGHAYCEGHQLEPVNGSLKVAAQNRTIWVKAGLAQQPTSVAAPIHKPIKSFDGGNIVCALVPKKDRSGYMIESLYPQAAET